MNRSRTWVVVVAVVLVATGLGWYFASPAYSMRQLKTAAESGDAVELEEYIDFPKVRESLKTELRAAMAREIAKPEMTDNPFGKFGAMMAMGLIDGMVEGFVTPESMAAMIQEGKMRRPGEGAKAIGDNQVDWKIERDGFDRFLASPEGNEGKPTPSLIFERDGFGWKLSGIKLPAEELPRR